MRVIFFLTFFCFFLLAAFAQTCGNNSCETGENSCTCEEDCGLCSGTVPDQTCKEYTCSPENQCVVSEVLNCCGNTVCEESEDYSSCSVDCIPKVIEIKKISPDFSRAVYGEKILLKVQLLGDGKGISGGYLTAKGFFGEIELKNDGMHEDEKPADSFYAETIEVLPLMGEGEQDITLKASFRGVDSNFVISLLIDPKIEIEMETPEEIFLTDKLVISGKASLKEEPLEVPLQITITSESGMELQSETVFSSHDGFFSTGFQTSILDPAGEWIVTVKAEDQFSNKAFEEIKLLVGPPEEKPPAEIKFFIGPKQEYSFSEKLEVSVIIEDLQENRISGALVEMALADSQKIDLAEIQDSIYSGSIIVPRNIGTGQKELEITALATVDGQEVKLSKKFSVGILPESFFIEVVKPNKISYPVGEQLEFEIKVMDSAGNPVNDAEVIALIGPVEVEMKIEELGVYRGTILVDESFEAEQEIFFSVKDSFGNEASKQTEITISGKTYWYDLSRNFFLISGAFIILLIAGIIGVSLMKKKNRLADLVAKKTLIDEKMKMLQEAYFHNRQISKEEYNSSMEKYQKELKEAENAISEEKTKK